MPRFVEALEGKCAVALPAPIRAPIRVLSRYHSNLCRARLRAYATSRPTRSPGLVVRTALAQLSSAIQ